MSTVVTLGGLTASAANAYTASHGATNADSAAFGYNVGSFVSALVGLSKSGAFTAGFNTGAGAGLGAVGVGLSASKLINSQTPAEALSGALAGR